MVTRGMWAGIMWRKYVIMWVSECGAFYRLTITIMT